MSYADFSMQVFSIGEMTIMSYGVTTNGREHHRVLQMSRPYYGQERSSAGLFVELNQALGGSGGSGIPFLGPLDTEGVYLGSREDVALKYPKFSLEKIFPYTFWIEVQESHHVWPKKTFPQIIRTTMGQIEELTYNRWSILSVKRIISAPGMNFFIAIQISFECYQDQVKFALVS